MRLALCALVVAACTSENVVVGDLQEVTSLKAIPNHELDVLFVVDNSPSMLDKQASLAANFPRMIDVLSTLDDGLPDLHIGVVTSDLGTSGSHTAPAPDIGAGPGGCHGTGDAGNLQQTPAMTARYLADGTYTGALRDAFSQLAQVGDQGCGFEQHLGAMRTALDNTANSGFLRDSANLAVVILADEDDCSVADSAFFGPDTTTLGPLQSFRCFRFGVQCDPDDATNPGDKSNCRPRTNSYLDDVSPFADFLVGLKTDARRVMVAGVVGDPTPVSVELAPPPGGGTPIPTLAHSCTFAGPTGPEVADPAVRIASFLDHFPGRSRLTSICNDDLSGAVADIGQSAKQLMGDPCLDTSQLADTSDAPGVQPACEVADVRDAAPTSPTTIPPCADAAGTCYQLTADPVACPATSDHLRIQIRRTTDATADTWTHVRCQRR